MLIREAEEEAFTKASQAVGEKSPEAALHLWEWDRLRRGRAVAELRALQRATEGNRHAAE